MVIGIRNQYEAVLRLQQNDVAGVTPPGFQRASPIEKNILFFTAAPRGGNPSSSASWPGARRHPPRPYDSRARRNRSCGRASMSPPPPPSPASALLLRRSSLPLLKPLLPPQLLSTLA
ncbi:hypothetical protein MLD38_028123 [Melastoma candidum]|uniref:Uncharacterized protein n=1 Tax=Melastoma candidum TaxID=119954 RepID=A0ACB9N0X8_9MYRT|nr:hypothetical protein MLD38_028123 [Melastoma candidum]